MPLTISGSEKDELLVTYAALILHDDKLDISAENISKLVAAAGTTVEPYWPKLFATLLQGKNVGDLLTAAPAGGGGGGGAPSGGSGGDSKKEEGGAAGGGGGGGKKGGKEKQKEKEKEAEPEEEADLGFSLFD